MIPICAKCGAPLTDTNWNRSQRVKHNYKCKDCTRKEARAWWRAYGRDYNKQRFAREDYLPKRRQGNKKYRDRLALVKAGKTCVCCGRDVDLTIDHIIPISPENYTGGTARLLQFVKDPTNLQILCQSCNSSKKRRPFCRIHKQYLGDWTNVVNYSDYLANRGGSSKN